MQKKMMTMLDTGNRRTLNSNKLDIEIRHESNCCNAYNICPNNKHKPICLDTVGHDTRNHMCCMDADHEVLATVLAQASVRGG